MSPEIYNFLWSMRGYFEAELVLWAFVAIRLILGLVGPERLHLSPQFRCVLYRAFRWAPVKPFLWIGFALAAPLTLYLMLSRAWLVPLSISWWVVWTVGNAALLFLVIAVSLNLKRVECVPKPEILGYSARDIALGLGSYGPREYVVQFVRESTSCASIHFRSTHPLAFFYTLLPRRTDNSRFAAYLIRKYAANLQSMGISTVELASHYVDLKSIEEAKVVKRAAALFPGWEVRPVEREMGWWKSGWIRFLSRREPPNEVQNDREAVAYVAGRIQSREALVGLFKSLRTAFGEESRRSPYVARGIAVDLPQTPSSFLIDSRASMANSRESGLER